MPEFTVSKKKVIVSTITVEAASLTDAIVKAKEGEGESADKSMEVTYTAFPAVE